MISIVRECDDAHGWRFDAEVVDRRGDRRAFSLRLAWVDYNHWSPDGAARPEHVATAVLRFLLAREPAAEIAESFDAARVRRRYPDADDIIPTMIRPVSG